MCEQAAPPAGAAAGALDDVWDDGDSGDAAHGAQGAGEELGREWAARREQYHNAGFREGVEEGKACTLQAGFNAGFAEGARAGYECGLLHGALQALAAALQGAASGEPASSSQAAAVEQLRQEAAAVAPRAVMRDTCSALAHQRPDEALSQQLEAALAALQLEGNDAQPSAAGQGAAPAAPGASSEAAGAEPPPLQLVARLKQRLAQLGYDVGAAPPFSSERSRTGARTELLRPDGS